MLRHPDAPRHAAVRRTSVLPLASRATVLAASAFSLAGCLDSTAPSPLPGAAGHALTATAPPPPVLPSGKGVGTRTTLSANRRTRYPVEYHDGPVMLSTVNVYFIWYGTWASADSARPILTDLVTHLGGSPYHAINTRYPDANGARPSNSLFFGGATDDAYSHGYSLSDADVAGVVVRSIDNLQLPLDPNGIYVVLPSADVVTSGLGTAYCAFHHYTTHAGSPVKYAFIGNPERAPSQCARQRVGPNGTLAADGMALLLAGEISNVITDPELNAWYDRAGLEPADKCAWSYGRMYRAPNGARANVRLGARDYLLQRLWVPKSRGGSCELALPPARSAAAADRTG